MLTGYERSAILNIANSRLFGLYTETLPYRVMRYTGDLDQKIILVINGFGRMLNSSKWDSIRNFRIPL